MGLAIPNPVRKTSLFDLLQIKPFEQPNLEF
jgi:hypothetical protein